MSDKELFKRYEAFLSEYGNDYDKETLDFIKEKFWSLRYSTEAPGVLRQIYSELDAVTEKDDIYIAHLKNIKENFNISKNILDIGCGFYPAFGCLVAKEQLKLGNGTITLYDQNLVMKKPKYQNMVLRKEMFTHKITVKDFDLITGIYPCEATELIIKTACENKKDFYLAMCGCTHFDYYNLMRYGGNPEIYQEYVIYEAEKLLKEHKNGELVVEKLEDHYGVEYPILYNKKRKKLLEKLTIKQSKN